MRVPTSSVIHVIGRSVEFVLCAGSYGTCASRSHEHRIERLTRRDEQAVLLRAAEAEIDPGSGR